MDKELQEDNPRGVEVRRASPQVEVAPRGLLELEHRLLQQLVTLLDSCMSPMRDACRPAVGSWRQRRLTGKAELATVYLCVWRGLTCDKILRAPLQRRIERLSEQP